MAGHSIPQPLQLEGMEGKGDWEGHFYAEGCALARASAEAYFVQLDEELYQDRPAGWKVIGFRERRLLTRFGEVVLRRRLYQDEAGVSHFLVDEHLGLPAKQAATPSLQEAVVAMTTDVAYRKAAKHVTALTAGVLEATTVWRLTQRVGAAALAQEAQDGEAVYKQGQRPHQEGRRVAERLFVEADGVYVRLQREEQRHLEIKSAIAYEGWERLGGALERYRLQEKRVYVHGVSNLAFWEGAGLALGRHWDWSRVQHVVLGGDGAAWIAAGTEWLAESVRQLDGFHLARATGRALGQENGHILYQTIRAGDFAAAQTLWEQAPKRQQKSTQRDIRWLDQLLADQQGQDWRSRLALDPACQRGLGAMEGNGAHLIADRMKGKGRSWSRRGACHMAKVRQLVLNAELHLWCGRMPTTTPSPSPTNQRPKRRKLRDTSSWLHAHVPALYGPHSQRPWARRLHSQIHSTD